MKYLFAILCLLVAPAAVLAPGDDDAKKDDGDVAARDAAVVAEQLPSYPLKTTCVVSGEAIEGDPVEFVVEGRMYRTCCKRCARKIVKDPATFAKKVVDAVIADQGPRYPMDACVVSSESFEEEGMEPLDMVFGTRLVRFCCKGCVKGYEASPGTFMASLDEAWMESQRSSYPLEACVISGKPLERPQEILYGVTLVQLCCKGCKKAFDKDPEKHVATLGASGGKGAKLGKGAEGG